RKDSTTAPGRPIRLAAGTFLCPAVTRTRSHLAARACSSSVLATLVLARRNGVFLPPVTKQMRYRRKEIHAPFATTRAVEPALRKRSKLRGKPRQGYWLLKIRCSLLLGRLQLVERQCFS